MGGGEGTTGNQVGNCNEDERKKQENREKCGREGQEKGMKEGKFI